MEPILKTLCLLLRDRYRPLLRLTKEEYAELKDQYSHYEPLEKCAAWLKKKGRLDDYISVDVAIEVGDDVAGHTIDYVQSEGDDLAAYFSPRQWLAYKKDTEGLFREVQLPPNLFNLPEPAPPLEPKPVQHRVSHGDIDVSNFTERDWEELYNHDHPYLRCYELKMGSERRRYQETAYWQSA